MSDIDMTVKQLRELVAGPVLGPDDQGFEAEAVTFNTTVNARPALVVGALDRQDVAASVRFAAEQGLAVAVTSTGHGAVPGGMDGALVINTSRIREISVDPQARTVRIGAGNRWGEVVEACAPFGLMPPAGAAPGVGVVGYLLGGGLSPLGRVFGFAADHVRALEIVTADGTHRRVDAEQHEDLFWALRGGGGGLGVVTAVEVGLFPVSSLYGGTVFYPGEHAADLLRAFRDWNDGLPDAACGSLALQRLPDVPQLPEPLRGRFVVALRFAYPGDPAEGARLLAPMRATAEAIIDTVGELPLTAFGAIHNDPTEPMPVWDRGDLLPALPDGAIDALLSAAGPQAADAPTLVELRRLGGALARAPRQENALGVRDAAYTLFVVGAPGAPSGPGLFATMAPWTLGAGLPTMRGEAPVATTPEVAARLAKIKATWDPAGLLR
ncbi:FAD-binding oxidoreductase [Nonomuraea sediminis]|uniref:FAD-binding oxidoreductase n=1 Tax=Nonomuraea sediminis TaxID=2835864 RepID=UPI001BDC8BAE|nr:FAD-binding protein [Nonomuraea sediminis]